MIRLPSDFKLEKYLPPDDFRVDKYLPPADFDASKYLGPPAVPERDRSFIPSAPPVQPAPKIEPLVEAPPLAPQIARRPPLTRQKVTSRVVEDVEPEYELAPPVRPAGRPAVVTMLSLPEGYKDWSEVPGITVARSAVRQYGKQRGIPDDFLNDWINTRTLTNAEGDDLRLYNTKTGRSIEGKDLRVEPDGTVKLEGELPFLEQLENDWRSKGESVGEKIVREAKDPRVAPGELVIGNAANIAEKVSRVPKAINALGNSITQAGLNVATATNRSGTAGEILSNIPDAVEAELRGRDSGVENPVVTIENELFGSAMDKVHPSLKPAVNTATDFLTSPDTLLLLGAGKAAKAAGKLTEALRASEGLSILGKTAKVEALRDGTFKLSATVEGKPFSVVLNPKELAARKAVASSMGEAGFIRVPSLDQYVNVAKKAGLTTLDIANSYKAFRSAYDVSAAGRQGLLLAVNHPVEAAKTFLSQFKAMGSDAAFSKMMRPLLDTPLQDVRERAGLWLSSVNNPEEVFAGGNFASRIPGVDASERAYNYFLDRMRIHSFDSFMAANPSATEKDLQEVARFINWSSGRGSLGPLEGTSAAKVLQQAFWSPRLNISRFQTALSPALLRTPLARKYAARQLATFISTGVGILGAAKAMGVDAEVNPLSSDFGKVQIGAQHYDLFGGWPAQIRYLAQMATGEAKPMGADVIVPRSRLATAESFARTRLTPAIGIFLDWKTGRFVTGEEVTKEKLARNALLPLSLNDVADAFVEDREAGGSGLGAVKALPSFAGIGVQTIPEPRTEGEREMRRVAVGAGRQTLTLDAEGVKKPDVLEVVKRAIAPVVESEGYKSLSSDDEKRRMLFTVRKYVQNRLVEGVPEESAVYNARVFAESFRQIMKVEREVKDEQKRKLLSDRINEYWMPAMLWKQGWRSFTPPRGDRRSQSDIEGVFERKRAGADAWLDEQISRMK